MKSLNIAYNPSGAPALDAALMLAGAYGATWALAALSYQCIEEPFLRMRRGYGASAPSATRAADAVK